MESLKLNNKRGLLAVVMALAMVFAGAVFIADEADATFATTVYVDAVNGDDSSDGTEDAPVKSLMKAFEKVSSKTKIILKTDVEWNSTDAIEDKVVTIVSADVKKKISLKSKMALGGDTELTIEGCVIHSVNTQTEPLVYDGSNGHQINSSCKMLTMKDCDFTCDSGIINREKIVDPHSVYIGGGSATFENVNFNGIKVTYTNSSDYTDGGLVVFRECDNIYLNQGVNIEFIPVNDTGIYDGPGIVVGDSEIDVLKVYQGCEVDLNGINLEVGTILIKDMTSNEEGTIKNGSISGTFDVYEQDADGSLYADVTLQNVNFTGVSTISSNAIINATSATVIKGAILNVNGVVSGTGLVNEGTITVAEGSNRLPTNVAGNGTIGSSTQEEADLGGTIKSNATFGPEQIVTLVSDSELIDTTILTIEGTLIIPEGVTLTLSETSVLYMKGVMSKLINNGTIVVESLGQSDIDGDLTPDEKYRCDGAAVSVVIEQYAENNGTIILAAEPTTEITPGWFGTYEMYVVGAILENNGVIDVYEDNALGINRDEDGSQKTQYGGFIGNQSDATTTLKNNAGAEISVNGVLIGFVDNKGMVTIDGYANVFISNMTVDALVDVVSYKSLESTSALTIDNIGLAYDPKDKTKVVSASSVDRVVMKVMLDDLNEQNVYSIGGIVFRSVITSAEGDDGKTVYGHAIDVSGDVDFDTNFENYTVTTDTAITAYGFINVSEQLSIPEDVKFEYTHNADQSKDILAVSGQMTVSKDSHFSASKMLVNGKVVSYIENVTETGFIAAKYTVKKDVTNNVEKHTIYTTLAQAIGDGATDIEMLGDLEVDTEITIPSGVTVEASETTTVTEDGALTVSDGAKLKIAGADVDGVLLVENKKNLSTTDNVVSDVVTTDDRTILYSGLAYALSVATDGQTVKVSDYADVIITLGSDATIASGVTLDTNTRDLKVGNDATLTIYGTLYLNNGELSVQPVNEDGTGAAGKVVLNGAIKSVDEMDYDIGSSPLSAAYYIKVENSIPYNYVEPVALAAPRIADEGVSDMEIRSYITDLKVGAVSFTGTSDNSVTVTVKGNVSGSITVDLATVAIQSGKFVGSVTNGVGTIGLDGSAVGGSDKALKVESTTKDDVKTLTVSGQFKPGDKKKVLLEGDVTITELTASPVTVEGDVTVAKSSNIVELTVNGTVTVSNEATLTVTDAYVIGTVTVSEATDKPAGKLSATDLYVGLVKKDVYVEPTTTEGAATVSGNTAVSNHLFVLAGATIPEDLVDEDTPYQELYVEGKLWMTVYAFGTDLTVDVNQIPVENVEFQGWASEEGKDGKDVTEVKIENKKVYADIEYDVYKVKFVIAEGIDDVYIDNVLVNDKKAIVAAGTHTISYTLANGYTGEAKMLVNGTAVSGYSFTTEGEFSSDVDVSDYIVTLQGIEKAPAEVGGGDAPVTEKEEGMSLTDILLIILVVLIVIMAVIVALRMMRS